MAKSKMSDQEDLFSSRTVGPVEAGAPHARKAEHLPAPVWLQRLSIVILVVFCFYVGLLVLVLPWTRYWNESHYLLTSPAIGSLMNSGITRGVVSGLGLLDLWIGISEIVHYREYRA